MGGKPISIKSSFPICKQWQVKNSKRKIPLEFTLILMIIRVHLTRDILNQYEKYYKSMIYYMTDIIQLRDSNSLEWTVRNTVSFDKRYIIILPKLNS